LALLNHLTLPVIRIVLPYLLRGGAGDRTLPLDRVPGETTGFGAQKKTASANAASATTFQEPPVTQA